MLDYVCVFTKGGSLLWALSFVGLKGDPINALIRACLLEERAGQSSFEYIIPSGGTYALKWSLNNVSSLFSLLPPAPTSAMRVRVVRSTAAPAWHPAAPAASPAAVPARLRRTLPLPRHTHHRCRAAGPRPRVCGSVPKGAEAAVRGRAAGPLEPRLLAALPPQLLRLPRV